VERGRVAGIREMIQNIKALPLECLDLTSIGIRRLIIDSKMDVPPTCESFAEFTAEAEEARVIALYKMTRMADAAEAAEAAENQRLQEKREQELAALAEEEARAAAELAEAVARRNAEYERIGDEWLVALREEEEERRSKEAERAQAEEKRLNELTADYATTLKAIMHLGNDPELADSDARKAMTHLAVRGLERGKA
jgi:hypothetical protein